MLGKHQVLHRRLTESPDTITPPIPVVGETPTPSQEVTGSPDTLLPAEVPIIVEPAIVHKEESGSHTTVTLVPAFEEQPGAPEADSGRQKSVPVSLLAAVKSLSSPRERTSLPDTGLPPLPGVEGTPVGSPEMTGSPSPLLPPEVPEIVVSPTPQEENAVPISLHETSTIREKPGASQEDTGYPDLPNSPDPVTVESTGVPGQDSPLAEQVPFEAGKGDESVQQPAPGVNPSSPGSPPPSAGTGFPVADLHHSRYDHPHYFWDCRHNGFLPTEFDCTCWGTNPSPHASDTTDSSTDTGHRSHNGCLGTGGLSAFLLRMGR